jgi:hypothetical protein
MCHFLIEGNALQSAKFAQNHQSKPVGMAGGLDLAKWSFQLTSKHPVSPFLGRGIGKGRILRTSDNSTYHLPS